jgi:hypothetical protein
MCNGGGSMKMVAQPGGLSYFNYTWMPSGVNGQTLVLQQTQATIPVTVMITDNNGCTGSASITGTVFGVTPLQITGSNSVCSGGTVMLTGSGAQKYQWNTGATTNTIIVSPNIH